MKNPALTFKMTADFDRIVAEEVYPAIIKAFGTMRKEEQGVLLAVAASHLASCLTSLCYECRDTYLHSEINKDEVNRLLNLLELRDKHLNEAD